MNVGQARWKDWKVWGPWALKFFGLTLLVYAAAFGLCFLLIWCKKHGHCSWLFEK